MLPSAGALGVGADGALVSGACRGVGAAQAGGPASVPHLQPVVCRPGKRTAQRESADLTGSRCTRGRYATARPTVKAQHSSAVVGAERVRSLLEYSEYRTEVAGDREGGRGERDTRADYM